MSGYDPNDPNNQWGNQGWQQGQQQPGQQQQGQGQQQPGQQQQGQQQQGQWGQQPQQQQGQWDQQQQWQQQQQQQQQQQWQQQQQQPQQQQWGQQPEQQQWGQQPEQQQQGYDPNQYGQQQQAYDPNQYGQQQQGGYPQQDQSQGWQQQGQDQAQGWQGQAAAGFGGGAAAAVADGYAAGDSADSRGGIQGAVATLGQSDRVTFIKKTYAHLAGAILLFAGLEYFFFATAPGKELAAKITKFAIGGGQYNWLIFLGLFMVAGYGAEKWANNATSRAMQYMGLIAYTVAEAIIFVPLLWIAMIYMDAPEIISQAGVITLALFGGLTAIVFITRKDFSFLKGALIMMSMVAMGTIVAAIVFGFSLGIVFSVAMVGLAGLYILYYTSKVMAHYHPQQYVAAALSLFAAVALLFWYVIRILMELKR